MSFMLKINPSKLNQKNGRGNFFESPFFFKTNAKFWANENQLLQTFVKDKNFLKT